MVQLPSAARLSGNKKPAASARCCSAAKTQPASAVMVRLLASRSRTWFMRCRLSTSWLPELSGVLPTTRPVLPPCGTMLRGCCGWALRCSIQARTMAATCAVLPGRSTAKARPCSRLRQSCSQALRSPSVSTWAGPSAVRSRSSRCCMAQASAAAARSRRRTCKAQATNSSKHRAVSSMPR